MENDNSSQEYSFQLLIRAKDGGTPPLTSQTLTLTVNVRRNMYAPYFIGTPYRTSVNQTATSGTPVIQVRAQDQDRVSKMLLKC